MPSEVTTTTIQFTYNVPNAIYSTDDSEGNTGTAEYTGPDRIWVFVDENTGAFSRITPPLTAREDGADVPTPFGHKKVQVVAADDPFIISLILGSNVQTLNQTTVNENLPDGSTISYNGTPTIDQAYDLSQLTYDLDANTWNTPSYQTSPITWDDVINARNGALTASDGKIAPDQPDSVKQPWINYRQALRDIPSTFGKGTDNEIDAWKVKLPTPPGDA